MRRRYVYREVSPGVVEPFEVDADYQRYEERQPVVTDRYMEGQRAPDGTPIDSRWKRKEWMRQTGTADLSDYTQHLQQAQAKREAWLQGKSPLSKEMQQDIGRAAYEARNRRGKR